MKHTLIVLSFLLSVYAQSITRSPWQYIRGRIYPPIPNPAWINGAMNCSVPCSNSCDGHGDPNVYNSPQAAIPLANASWGTCATNDTYCKSADDIYVVGPSSSRLIYACGGTAYPNGNKCPCLQFVDYTWFQTFVLVPIGGTVTSFKISFTNMDDGSLVTVINNRYPNGIFIPGSYVQFCRQTLTTDLASYLVTGSNRVVITQVDDCPIGNNIQASVVINGIYVPPSCDTVACQAGVWNPTLETCIYSPLPDGTNCTDYNVCTQTDRCSAGKCVGLNPLDCTPPDTCRTSSCDPSLGCVYPLKLLGNSLPINGSTAFNASISFTPSGMSGAVNAALSYNWTANTMVMLGSGWSRVYGYNSMRGENASSQTQYFGQTMYTLSNQCSNGQCEHLSITCSMPQLFIGDRWTTQNQVGTIGNRVCTIYTPVPCYTQLNPCLSTLYMSGNTLCGAQFVDGSFFVVNSIDTNVVVPPLSSFLSSTSNCTCGRAIDMVIALDRSSIQTTDRLASIVAGLQKFATYFNFGFNNVIMGITEFRSVATPILSLSSGTSLASVQSGIGSISCDSSSACCSRSSGCTRSISSGIISAANMLIGTGSRKYASKVIIVISGGNQDTLSNGSQCFSACSSTDLRCMGDADGNGIPDKWQPYNASLNQNSVNYLANCQTDLVNARIYAQNLLTSSTSPTQPATILSISLDSLLTDLDIATNQRYTEVPSNYNCGSSTTTNPQCLPANYVPCGGVANGVTSACWPTSSGLNVLTTVTSMNSSSVASSVSGLVCTSNIYPCGSAGCCGFCTCGGCNSATTCYNQSFCSNSVLSKSGNIQCCTPQSRQCTSPDTCQIPSCNDALGTCQLAPVQCNQNTNCTRYQCVNGSCIGFNRVLDYPPGVCNTTYCSSGILYINQPKVCTGTDKCQNYYCDPSSNSCTSSPKPCTPTNKCFTTQCDPSVGTCNQIPTNCSGPYPKCYNYYCDVNTGLCSSTFLGYAENSCYDTYCTDTGLLVNNSAKVCSGPDRCLSYYCSVELGGVCISKSAVDCVPPNSCYTSVCNSSTGKCDITPKSCPASTKCYDYVCQNSTGQCSQVLRASPASDSCHISDCINGSLVDNQPVNCTGPNLCLNYFCDLSNNGICSFTSKGDSCYDCVSNASSCQPPDFCHTAACINTSCIFTPKLFTQNITNCQTYTTDGTNPSCFIVKPSGICETGDPCYINECVPTNTTNPQCISTPVCGVSDACYSRSCNKGTCSNQSLCTEHLENTCIVFNGCDPLLGCNYSQVVCDDAQAGSCNVFVRNSSYPGCCQPVPKDCSLIDQCYTYGCNMNDGNCFSTPKCNLTSTACFQRSCNPSVGVCNTDPIVCPPSSDPCKVSLACDESKGGCAVAEKCVSDDPCVIATCDVNGQCQYNNVTCDDGSACTQDFCSNGACVFKPITCSTNSTCYSLSCNASALPGADPCYQVPKDIDTICNDNNPCTNDHCDDAQGGCYYENKVCTSSNITSCEILTCDPREGCIAQPRLCILVVYDGINDANGNPTLYSIEYSVYAKSNSSNSSSNTLVPRIAPDIVVGCSVALCDESDPTLLPDNTYTHCSVKFSACASFDTSTVVAISAGISGGVVAGIVIAIALCLSFTGGASYAGYAKWSVDQDFALQSNPLYQNSQTGGENPLHEKDVENSGSGGGSN
eukprot:TRINITY_DN8072_c0_g1_i1.p1 TRINITY_DN8072_c0_g1~~TRINITY_DN8072_c0_g1_i1.p1  ORF type:complete len:1667 (-),score=343.07 TRINITY_DN8072_c0_g1_i1:165-5165(-)